MNKTKPIEQISKPVDKKKPSGWSNGHGNDFDPTNIDAVLAEAFNAEKYKKDILWYLIQFQLAILDYHTTRASEDMAKAKIYGEQLLNFLSKS